MRARLSSISNDLASISKDLAIDSGEASPMESVSDPPAQPLGMLVEDWCVSEREAKSMFFFLFLKSILSETRICATSTSRCE